MHIVRREGAMALYKGFLGILYSFWFMKNLNYITNE
jgi:hypothetical protein